MRKSGVKKQTVTNFKASDYESQGITLEEVQ